MEDKIRKVKGSKVKISKKKFPVFEFAIDKKYFPKNKGNLSKEYNKKQANILLQLHDLELELIFSELKIKNIFSVLFGKKRKNRPMNMFYIQELNEDISRFNTGYENYCLRLFIYREIISSFVARFLKIQQTNFWEIIKDSKISELRIDKCLEKFDKGILKELIGYRHKITHKIEFSSEKQKKNSDKKEQLLEDLKTKNQKIKKSLNEILKIKKKIEQQVLSQYSK